MSFKYETGKHINNQNIPLYVSDNFDEAMKVFRDKEYDFLRRCLDCEGCSWIQNWIFDTESWTVAECRPFNWCYNISKVDIVHHRDTDIEIVSMTVNTLEEAVAFQLLFESERNFIERNAPAGKYQIRQKWDNENNCWDAIEFYDNGTRYDWLPVDENWTHEVTVNQTEDVNWHTFESEQDAFEFAEFSKNHSETKSVSHRRYRINGNQIVVEYWNEKMSIWHE
jgi:hypothetical protein